MSKDRLIITGLIMCLILVAIPLVLADTSKDGTLFNNSSDKITSIQSGAGQKAQVDPYNHHYLKILGTHCGPITDNRGGPYSVKLDQLGWRSIKTDNVPQNQAILQLCCDAYTSGKTMYIATNKNGYIVDAYMEI